MPHAIVFTESNLVNPPDPIIGLDDLRLIEPTTSDEDSGETWPQMFTHFYGNDEFGWTVTFDAYWDPEEEEANTSIIRTYYVNSVVYNSTYDFLNVDLGEDYAIFSRAGNPFDERFTLVQTSQGDIDKDFTTEVDEHGENFTFDFDENPIDANNFNYSPPEDELFDYERNQYTLQDIRQRIENDDIEYLGCSEWKHPDEKEILLTHSFTVYVDYHQGPDEQYMTTLQFNVVVLQELHWDFYRSYTTALYLRDNGKIQDKDPVDGVPDDIEIVVADQVSEDGNTNPLLEDPPDDITITQADLKDTTFIQE